MIHPPKQDESQISPQGNPNDSGFRRDALEIKITRGTSNKMQIATFQREAHNVLVSALNSSDSINYVAVEEVPAANWGFEGLTQEARFHS